MDYVVGSVAALISGNVTPNRPKLIRRALTPTKHQPSPNVTPKSEFVEDRSIFLSPTQQKKKAIVKKSPKRIFQNPDLDVTEGYEGNSSLTSPQAEKVKKHLKGELEAENMGKKKSKSPTSTLNKSSDDVSPIKKSTIDENSSVTDGTPKKRKKNKRNSESNVNENENAALESVTVSETIPNDIKSPKKKQRKPVSEKAQNSQTNNYSQTQENSLTIENINESSNKSESKKNKKQKKKNKKALQNVETAADNKENNHITTETNSEQSPSKKKKNRKNKTKNTEANNLAINKNIKPLEEEKMEVENEANSESESEEVRSKNIPNPNAITEKDSDSEHDSDNDIESENEEANKKVLTNEDVPPESSDDEGDKETKPSNKKPKEKNKEEKGQQVMTEDEVKRTLFVGNVPFSKKCKKEVKKIFSKYGQIETIRIRTIPVKDGRVTPKLAVIKNELHPERSTVNVYIKYGDTASVGKAIAENNTVLNGNHLRVSRSESTGSEHDPHCAVFVGNLPFAVEDDVFRSKFEKCGEIVSVRIIRDKKTNAGKGFGYINFASKDGVELALALSEEDLTIKNRILRVKRCTLTPGKQGNQGGKPGFQGGRQGNQGGRPGFQGGRQGNQRGRPGFRGGRQSNQGMRQGNQESRPGFQGGRQGNQVGGGKWGQQGGKWGDQGPEGAARRLMNKRKIPESGGEGPPTKRQHVNQPAKEKKQRKEFVGITADKKKKHKFDKGQKKKKALSEILTKKS